MTAAITVVGGTYGEECCYPRRKIFRGSGGRAAAILKSLGATVELHSVVGPQLGGEFSAIAQQIGYSHVPYSGTDDVWFRYRHPLGRPDIHPMTAPVWQMPKEIRADAMLVFGMIEGRPVTHGGRVVYDPQDGARAVSYGANGSTARELALVVSYSEGRAITHQDDPHQIAAALLRHDSAVAVIVKCGPQGALVQTRDSNCWVYPFPTIRVYKIGSGDAFSAAFAHEWIVNGATPMEAAWFASRVAAAYVESGQDQFDTELVKKLREEAQQRHKRVGRGSRRSVPDTQIYLAGPFFHTAQQWAIDEARGALLDMGFKVFSPIHDVGEGPADFVASKDLEGLRASGVVLALVDGLDSGTLFEVGYAVACDIPVVVVAESVSVDPLTMLLGSDCFVTNDLSTGLYAACWKVMGDV